MALNHSPKIVTNGLVLYLDAANQKSYPGSGTTWTDLSGNGNTGTLTNGPTFSANNNGGIVFDGANDYVSIPNSSSLNITGRNITIEVIFKSNDLASSQHADGLLSKGSGSNDGVYELGLLPANSGSYNTVWFRVRGLNQYSPKILLMNLNSVYMIHGVLNEGLMTTWVNGLVEDSGLQTTGNIQSSSLSVALGSRQLQQGTSSSSFNGSIYSTKIYNRALSAQEIQQNFNATRGRYGL